MIELKNVTKVYDSVKAVDDLSFQIQKGEIIGFLGPNGAGKSTTLKMMSGLLQPTAGSISIFGSDVLASPKEAKAKIGYLSEKNPLYEEYSVKEYLSFTARLKNVGGKIEQQIADVVERTFIESVFRKPIRTLSKGYKQRVGLAAALLGNPELLLLDEPTVGLDPNQIVDIRNLIADVGKTTTVLLSTHILQEVKTICDKVIIINEGKLVAIDEPDNLARRLAGQTHLIVSAAQYSADTEEKLRAIEGIDNLEIAEEAEKTILHFYIQPDVFVQNHIASVLLEDKAQIIEMKLDRLSLETVFQKLTKGTQNE